MPVEALFGFCAPNS